MDPTDWQRKYIDPDIAPEATDITNVAPIPARGTSSLIVSDSQESEESSDPQRVYVMNDGTSPQFLQPHLIQIPIQMMGEEEEEEENEFSVGTSEEVPGQLEAGQLRTAACQICGDRGSGYHYSVQSCEGCKGFFKRTIQKGLTYTCKYQSRGIGMCTVNKVTRNGCQYCRYQKCLQIGMKREAVRDDRLPGGRQRKKRALVDDDQAMMHAVSSEEKHLDDEHKAMIKQLIDANPDRIPYPSANAKPPSELTIDELMQFGYMELKYIIEWAKKVPGFRELCVEDKMALLKSSFMELNTFRLAYRSVGYNNMVRFAEGVVLSRSVAESMGWGTELVSSTVEFAERLHELDVDKTEFCIMNAIVLTYPDAIGLLEKSKVTELQTRLLDVLRRYIFSKQSVDVGRFGKILLRLPTLRTVSAKAAERFLALSLEGVMPLNDLVQEMMS